MQGDEIMTRLQEVPTSLKKRRKENNKKTRARETEKRRERERELEREEETQREDCSLGSIKNLSNNWSLLSY